MRCFFPLLRGCEPHTPPPNSMTSRNVCDLRCIRNLCSLREPAAGIVFMEFGRWWRSSLGHTSYSCFSPCFTSRRIKDQRAAVFPSTRRCSRALGLVVHVPPDNLQSQAYVGSRSVPQPSSGAHKTLSRRSSFDFFSGETRAVGAVCRNLVLLAEAARCDTHTHTHTPSLRQPTTFPAASCDLVSPQQS